MVMGKRRKIAEIADEISPNPKNGHEEEETAAAAATVSEYELSREQRIKENLERMQKLGILDLSLKFKADSISHKRRNASEKKTPLREPLPSGPTRRSSRLQNVTPVSYSEVPLTKKGTALLEDHDDLMLEKGAKPEIYTEEHEKLLGSTERTWTLFVDGYSSDGRRIYDPVKGKTCHQCRQKTLGLRTHCSQCQMVQGQFCGDCLYMRYGEHVVEANENPDWICPVCRGICNCSLCRQAKGWPPTGPLYRRILKLGFKSVAHYLIEKNCAPSDLAIKKVDTPLSAKRSLVFSDMKDEKETEKDGGSSESNELEDNNDKPIPEGIAGRTRKRSKSNNGTLKRDDELVKEEAATEDIDASIPVTASQDSIARRLRARPHKP